jgi:hypothetical protein
MYGFRSNGTEVSEGATVALSDSIYLYELCDNGVFSKS